MIQSYLSAVLILFCDILDSVAGSELPHQTFYGQHFAAIRCGDEYFRLIPQYCPGQSGDL
jgi:hypothetical protein